MVSLGWITLGSMVIGRSATSVSPPAGAIMSNMPRGAVMGNAPGNLTWPRTVTLCVAYWLTVTVTWG